MVDFQTLFTMHSKRLTCIAFSIVRDWYEAEDVVQDAFIKAYKKIETIEDLEKVGSWLSTITVRTAIDYKRAGNRRCWVAADISLLNQSYFQSSVTTEGKVEIKLLKERLTELIHLLSESYQVVLLLKWEYGLKEDEIASILHLKSATVKTRLYRARKQLKQVMEGKYLA